ncbi:MAG: phosphodiesterase [Clostridia bacterium]|nr:phosphodiesterase [Clostridia bacterium]
MRLMIASDIHGDLECCKKMLEIYDREGCERLVLLGDILYHGPRNGLPCGYEPKGVIELLNARRDSILAVRGNCDTEVDQMVLAFPVLADYAVILDDGLTMYATHGHRYNEENIPPMKDGDVLLNGHTHMLSIREFGGGKLYVNPGSISLPKGGNPKSYIIYENRCFKLYSVEGELLAKATL